MGTDNLVNDLNLSLPFGVEIEINSFDSRNRPEVYQSSPLGSYDVAFIVNEATKGRVSVSKWCNNHHNNYWVVKPDSSCGMEVCSPVLKGWFGVETISNVVDHMNKDKRIKSDSRCSFHVHFDVSSLSSQELLSVICWWIKLESFFMDAMPAKRKVNPYCRMIAQSNIINDISQPYGLDFLVEKLGVSKYYTLNTFHYYNKRRKTIEFRIMDSSCCLSRDESLSWISLLHHFINRSLEHGVPSEFKSGDSFSGYCWLDPVDAFVFLGLMGELPKKIGLIRSWLINRLAKNSKDFLEFGIFSRDFKVSSLKEINKLEKLFHQI